jgi:imidazole glycerol-phosphate synthase subunit HisH
LAKVGIVNYGIGNVRSVENAVKHTGNKVGKIASAEEFSEYDVVILPGVGAFGKCAEKLKERALFDALKKLASGSQKLIGICVGHQLFYDGSDESEDAVGMNVYSGRVQHLSSLPAEEEPQKALRLPNVGYRNIYAMHGEVDIPSELLAQQYYFVHSYGCCAEHDESCFAYTIYGGRKISAISKKNNLISFQFHPERSRDVGLRLLDWAIAS